MEKIRLSLWDIFTFFMTGLVAIVMTLGILLARGVSTVAELTKSLTDAASIATALGFAAMSMAIGMLIEPFANYADRWLFSRIFKWATVDAYQLEKSDQQVLDYIVKTRLTPQGLNVTRPFHLFKDYVEQRQLSNTAIIFLSRFGFYRNCTFLVFIASIVTAVTAGSVFEVLWIVLTAFLLIAIFKRRADQFLSYMAPAIYRAVAADGIVGGSSPPKVAQGDVSAE